MLSTLESRLKEPTCVSQRARNGALTPLLPWSIMSGCPSIPVQALPMWWRLPLVVFKRRKPFWKPPVTAEFGACAARAFPNWLSPSEATLPPPEPGQMKLGLRPVATLVRKERNQSSPEEAVELEKPAALKVSSPAQLMALNRRFLPRAARLSHSRAWRRCGLRPLWVAAQYG